MDTGEMLRCENCHALIQKDSAQCPYCGALNVSGGEKQYMERLFDLKEDVEGLQSVPVQEYRKGFGSAGRVIKWTLIVLIIVAALAGAVFWVSDRFYGYELSEEDIKAQMRWEKENFPILDAMYAEGDYEGIMEFQGIHCDEDGYSVTNWEHTDFINVYIWYLSCSGDAERIDSGDYDDKDIYWLLLDAMFVLQDRSYAVYSAEEEELIDGYRQEVKELVSSRLGIQEELEQLYEECCSEDEYGTYFDYDLAKKKVKAFVKQYMKNTGK